MGTSRFSSHSEMPSLEGAFLPDTSPLPAPFQPHQLGSLARRQPHRPRSWHRCQQTDLEVLGENRTRADRRAVLPFQQGFCSLPRHACGGKEGSFLKLRAKDEMAPPHPDNRDPSLGCWNLGIEEKRC